MAAQKLYAGVSLREIRQTFQLSQSEYAARLGISLPYLSQMENNHRPISTGVILALAKEFDFDVTQLSAGESERMVADMKEALADPVFADSPTQTGDLQLTASNAPSLARAFLNLHKAYRQTQERLASLDEALGRENTSIAASPWEEVRDFFHYCDNYIDAVDRAAENFAKSAQLTGPDRRQAAIDYLKGNLGVHVSFDQTDKLRNYDPAQKILTLNQRSNSATHLFQILHQIGLLENAALFDATLDIAKFQSDDARAICRIGLANYFAGAAILPYARFLQAAEECRHDLEHLSQMFGASLEQIGHRLSTLQRPGLKGIPFFFVRVDQAGTITKRHSATRLQFARFGGACPMWNVHSAFETPGRFLRQLAETPDGVRYFCLARDVSKSGGRFDAPVRRFAIGLGCEISHASKLVYADGMDIANPDAFEPIGISCRICDRVDCHQRAVPPVKHSLSIDANSRGVLPYSLNAL